MRASPAVRRRSGPFILSARDLLLAAGIVAIGLAAFDVFHELHAKQVDLPYAVVGLLVGVLWLAAIILAYRGWRAAVLLAGAIAFAEFGVVASSHFEIGPGAIQVFVTNEGLPLATVDMALIPSCMLVVFGAAVCWSNPTGRNRQLQTLPLLIAALIGAVLVILQATDDLHRSDFGQANVEDGTFVAAVLASVWLAGGLWIARVRRTGALLIILATFGVWYSFLTLHLLKGGTSLNQIAASSGIGWALIAAGAAVMSMASFLVALGLLVVSFVPRRKPVQTSAASRAIRRGA
jgi:hypothetical protein